MGPRRLRQPEPKILQQLRRRGDNVYVVTEALQTQQEVQVTQARKQEGSGQFTLSGAVHLQVCGQPCPTSPTRVGSAETPLRATHSQGVLQPVLATSGDKPVTTKQPHPPSRSPEPSLSPCPPRRARARAT